MYSDVDIALRVLYCVAENTGLEFIASLLTTREFDERDKVEELAYAYASIYTSSKADSVYISVPESVDTNPLSEAKLSSACSCLCSSNREVKSKLARIITFSLSVTTARKLLSWREISDLPDRTQRLNLINLVNNASLQTAFTNSGDMFVELSIRNILPRWSTSCTPHGTCPHRVTTELMFEDANETITRILETPIKSYITRSAWRKSAIDFKLLFAAVATIQELCAGHPKVYWNENTLRRADKKTPAICIFSDFDAGVGDVVGVIVDNTVVYSRQWSMPVAELLLQWITLCNDVKVPDTEDICKTVIKGDPNTSVGHFL